MGTIYKSGKFTIRVNGFEHPPIHAHVTHTDGRAMVYLNGTIKNNGVPDTVMAQAKAWIDANLCLNGKSFLINNHMVTSLFKNEDFCDGSRLAVPDKSIKAEFAALL